MRLPARPAVLGTTTKRNKRKSNVIRFAFRKRPDGQWRGLVELPLGTKGKIPVDVTSATREGAVKAAAGIAEQIVDNPIIAAALPPGSGAAVQALKMLGKHAAGKKLSAGLKKLTGKGAKRVVSALAKLW